MADQGQTEETPEQRFRRLANKRVPNACKAVSLVGNLGSSQYGKTEEQIDLIINTLRREVDEVEKRLRNVKTAAVEFQL